MKRETPFKLLSILLLSSVFQGSSALADCKVGEQIDLRSIHAGIFGQLPIKNQGTYGVCYAYSASTVIDFHRLKKNAVRNGQMTDPLAAAIISTSAMAEMSIEGGSVCDVIDGLKKTGFGCSDSGSNAYQIKDLGSNMQQILVERVFMAYITRQKKFEPVSGALVDPAVRAKYENTLTKNQKEYLTNLTEAVNTFERIAQNRGILRSQLPSNAKIADFFQRVYQRNTWAAFEGDLSFFVIRKNCLASKFKMPALTCTDHAKADSNLIQVMDQELAKGLPVTANICANFLGNRRYQGANSTYTVARDCLMHSVAIIGKRERAGSCEYLIRNSWGSGYRYDWPSSAGDAWVNQYTLFGNLTAIQAVH